MNPVSPEQALPFLQYGALGVVMIMILIGSAFGFRMISAFERSVREIGGWVQGLNQNIDRTRHHLSNALMGLEDRIATQIEDRTERDSRRVTMPGINDPDETPPFRKP